MKRFLLTAIVALASIAPTTAQDKGTLSLTFGLYRTDKPVAMWKKFTPVIEVVQSSLQSSLKRPVDIELKIFKTYDQAIKALVAGDVDFVRFGPASFVTAMNSNEKINLLAMEHKKGKRRFKGVFVVPRKSPIKSLTDLRGKKFAFGDQNSTIGRYLAQAELLKQGVNGGALDGFKYLGAHDKVFTAVAIGDFHAGSLKISTYKKMNKKNQLRVIHEFDNVTKPWAARAGLPADVVNALRSSLTSMTNETALKSLKVSGFYPAETSEYDVIRDAMATAKKFTVVTVKKRTTNQEKKNND